MLVGGYLSMSLIEFREEGLFCPRAKVYVDPWKPVDKAIITHAHADHSRYGMKNYLAHPWSIPVMKHRLGKDINVQALDYLESISINGVKISMHPAGHIPGSAQVCLEYKGEKWVISGDYKLEDDGISTPFEPVPCTHFVTESTFGLPVFDWLKEDVLENQLLQWRASLVENQKVGVIYAYALGKAQRVMKSIEKTGARIYTHAAVERTNECLDSIIQLPERTEFSPDVKKEDLRGNIIIATPGSMGARWTKKIGPHETAAVSGWMRMRGTRRRSNVDVGFVMSDHADWKGLNEAVKLSRAEKVFVTHGYTEVYSKWLNAQGIDAEVVKTAFGDEKEEQNEEQKALD